MAIVNKSWILLFFLFIPTTSAIAHTIYAPNDIPLLDNRFRIDPNTEQVTIILNHPDEAQKTVLVRPDGSKLYAERHPDKKISWSTDHDMDIITIRKPMPGPWQAIATLHGDNRLQLLNPITLTVEKLPLKVYQNEYLTTHASLVENGEVMTNKDFLEHAKLTVTIEGNEQRLISLYKDNGHYYDSLPFDGKLSTHIFMDLDPGRYLLHIKTKNNIFIRSQNKDVVVFPSPLTYQIQPLINDSIASAQFTFSIDSTEIDPDSVTIDGLLTNNNDNSIKQLILHLTDQKLIEDELSINEPIANYAPYTFSGKVFATTKDGREISFQLPEYSFELKEPITITPIELVAISSEAIETASAAETTESPAEEQPQYLWIILSGLAFIIITGVLITLYLLKRKRKKLSADNGLSLDELTIDELQSPSKDLNGAKK